MSRGNVIFIKLSEGAKAPLRIHNSAAYDLYSSESIVVPSQGMRLVSTGVAMDISPLAGIISHRSGQNSKDGIWIYGLIDPDYRGIIKVNIMNMGILPFYVREGERIAQLRLVDVPETEMILVDNLTTTERGTNGFGSSYND